MTDIQNCRLCGDENILEFFNLGHQPLANALQRHAGDNELRFPLALAWCPDCSLVQLTHTVDPQTLFSRYVWVTATSSVARSYAQLFADAVLNRLAPFKKADYILEIASNDGTFLKAFERKGCRVLGVDPAENIVEMAEANGVPTRCGFFGKTLAEEIITAHGFPRVIVARNVLPHVAHLHDFVRGVQSCMASDSLLVVEVHYAKTILADLHYDSIYHEHLCYFTLSSLERLLNDHGLYVEDIGTSPISGGSIVVFVRKKPAQRTPALLAYESQEELEGCNRLESWQRFAALAREHKKRLLALVHAEIRQGKRIAGYGASARSSTLLNFCGVSRNQIYMIADRNPLKHDRFTPGTHIPVNSPESVCASRPDTILILAWNFLEEIARELKHNLNFGGSLLIPLPYPPQKMPIREVVYG